MSIIADIASLFGGNGAVAQFKAITSELKDLKEEYKKELFEQKKINTELKQEVAGLQSKVGKVEEMEEDCLNNYRLIKENYTNTLEKLIFMTGGKHRDE